MNQIQFNKIKNISFWKLYTFFIQLYSSSFKFAVNLLWTAWFTHKSSNESILMPMEKLYENLFLKFLLLYQLCWLLPKPFYREGNKYFFFAYTDYSFYPWDWNKWLKIFFYPIILKYLKISASCVYECIGIQINRSTFLGSECLADDLCFYAFWIDEVFFIDLQIV